MGFSLEDLRPQTGPVLPPNPPFSGTPVPGPVEGVPQPGEVVPSPAPVPEGASLGADAGEDQLAGLPTAREFTEVPRKPVVEGLLGSALAIVQGTVTPAAGAALGARFGGPAGIIPGEMLGGLAAYMLNVATGLEPYSTVGLVTAHIGGPAARGVMEGGKRLVTGLMAKTRAATFLEQGRVKEAAIQIQRNFDLVRAQFTEQANNLKESARLLVRDTIQYSRALALPLTTANKAALYRSAPLIPYEQVQAAYAPVNEADVMLEVGAVRDLQRALRGKIAGVKELFPDLHDSLARFSRAPLKEAAPEGGAVARGTESRFTFKGQPSPPPPSASKEEVTEASFQSVWSALKDVRKEMSGTSDRAMIHRLSEFETALSQSITAGAPREIVEALAAADSMNFRHFTANELDMFLRQFTKTAADGESEVINWGGALKHFNDIGTPSVDTLRKNLQTMQVFDQVRATLVGASKIQAAAKERVLGARGAQQEVAAGVRGITQRQAQQAASLARVAAMPDVIDRPEIGAALAAKSIFFSLMSGVTMAAGAGATGLQAVGVGSGVMAAFFAPTAIGYYLTSKGGQKVVLQALRESDGILTRKHAALFGSGLRATVGQIPFDSAPRAQWEDQGFLARPTTQTAP